MRKTLLNFFSLGFLKATDGLIVLFLVPIIVARIGIANFGIIAFVQVILNYGKTIVDYGFNISGVREIALSKENQSKLSQKVSVIFYTRAFIGLSFITLLFIAGQLIPYLREHATVFYWGYLLVLGHIFFTDWFFIGMQEAKFLALANLAIKLIYALLVIFLVKEEADYIYILAYQGIGGLAIGGFVLLFIRKQFGITFSNPKIVPILQYLKKDFKLLLSNLSIEINATYCILILKILTTNTLTGYFNVMYKLIQPIRFLLVVFSQTIFPIICEKTRIGWGAVKPYLKNSFALFAPLPFLMALLLYVFAEPVFKFFAGESTAVLLYNFRLYLLAPIIIMLNIPAYQILLAYERKSDYTQIYVSSLILNLILAFVLTKTFALTGLIFSIILTEAFITLGLSIMVKINLKTIRSQVLKSN